MCGSNQGWEIRAPVAVGVIGGVVTSTLLTLVLVPAVYLLHDALTAARSGRRPRRTS